MKARQMNAAQTKTAKMKPCPKPKGKAKAQSKEAASPMKLTRGQKCSDDFDPLSRRAKINRFTRSIAKTKKSFEKGDESKAPSQVIEECANSDKRKLWLNKYMGKSGNWGDIWAEETVEDASSKVAGSGRSWLFLNEIEEKLGKQVAAMMCNELDEKQKLLPEGDITHTRQHPDMKQSGRHGKQWKILVKDEEDEKKSKMRSVKVTTKVDLEKGLPEQLSMKDLPSTSSSASSTPVAQKSRKTPCLPSQARMSPPASPIKRECG